MQLPSDDPPSDVDISSIGVAESFVAHTKGTADRGIEIESVSLGVELLTRQCCCFVWTFRDQINLNIVYNEAYHDGRDMEKFLETVKAGLLKELGVV